MAESGSCPTKSDKKRGSVIPGVWRWHGGFLLESPLSRSPKLIVFLCGATLDLRLPSEGSTVKSEVWYHRKNHSAPALLVEHRL